MRRDCVNIMTHPFEITVCNPEVVEVHYAGGHLGKLWIVEWHKHQFLWGMCGRTH